MDVTLYAKAISNLLGNNVGFSVEGVDYSSFKINGNKDKPSETAIAEEVARLTNVNALADMRTKRDRLLSESDWTQSRDVTLSDDNDWKTYRQALRDLPSGKTTKAHVDAATWPTKP